MTSKNFFKVNIGLQKPTQSQIELVRRRALNTISHGRGKSKQLDAKSVEAMLRIVTGRYSDLQATLESQFRNVDYKLDSKFAQGVKQAKVLLILIEQDVRQLQSMGYDGNVSGIDYAVAVERLRVLANHKQSLNMEEV